MHWVVGEKGKQFTERCCLASRQCGIGFIKDKIDTFNNNLQLGKKTIRWNRACLEPLATCLKITMIIRECSHVTKFSLSLKFSPILFCIKEENFSANGNGTHSDWNCFKCEHSICCHTTHFLSARITGWLSLCVNTPEKTFEVKAT